VFYSKNKRTSLHFLSGFVGKQNACLYLNYLLSYNIIFGVNYVQNLVHSLGFNETLSSNNVVLLAYVSRPFRFLLFILSGNFTLSLRK